MILIVYSRTAASQFLWDDDIYITQRPAPTKLADLKSIWLELGATPQYGPLAYTTFWIEHRLFTDTIAPVSHVFNILLHLANVLLVWQLLRRLKVPGAWFAAAIFVVHPVFVESAAWVAPRGMLLSLLFGLLSLLALVEFNPLDQQAGSRPRWILYPISLAMFVLSLLSNPATLPLPLAILLLTWWKTGRLTRQDLRLQMPFFAVAILLAVVTIQNMQYGINVVLRRDNIRYC